MILYECTECGFGIGGSEPDDAEDAYQLAQEIQEHEERHRPDEQPMEAEVADDLPPMNFRCGWCGTFTTGSEAEVREFMGEHPCPPSVTPTDAVKQLLQEQAKRGAVILPDRPAPLTRADVRAIVREELTERDADLTAAALKVLRDSGLLAPDGAMAGTNVGPDYADALRTAELAAPKAIRAVGFDIADHLLDGLLSTLVYADVLRREDAVHEQIRREWRQAVSQARSETGGEDVDLLGALAPRLLERRAGRRAIFELFNRNRNASPDSERDGTYVDGQADGPGLPIGEVRVDTVDGALRQVGIRDRVGGRPVSDDVLTQESSPFVDGRSSPTVGDGQVAEGADTSSAADAAHDVGEQSAYRLLSGVTLEGAAELDAMPDDCLIEATGSYIKGGGGFSRCWARPVPSHVTGDERLWQVLVHGDSDYMSSLTTSELIGLARVLYVGGES